MTTAMEERQVIDRLWDTYGLTPPPPPRSGRAGIRSGRQPADRGAEAENCRAGYPNLGAIEEYARVNERYSYLTAQRDDVLTAKRELESVIRDITTEMTSIFVTEFQKLTCISSRPLRRCLAAAKAPWFWRTRKIPSPAALKSGPAPGKQLKIITLLSGGEKAFVAIALYFAILKVRPTPFLYAGRD